MKWNVFSNIIRKDEHKYTSHGHGCGFYSELIFVDSKALKWAHSWLRNYFSNAAYRQKATDRKPHPWPREV
jgi:hypothetical protein